MTPSQLRQLALSLPGVVAGEHMGHADFRVGGKVFATLGWPDAGRAMLKLPPARQAACLREHPAIFEPASGAWGRNGCTLVRLASVRTNVLRPLLLDAWRQRAAAALQRGGGAAPVSPLTRKETPP